MSDLITLLKVSAKGVGAKLTMEQSAELVEQIEQLQAQVKQLAQSMTFDFIHNESGEHKVKTMLKREIYSYLDGEVYPTCDCEPIGETNVVECGCDEYYEGFEFTLTPPTEGE